jgi:thymidylate kinase
MTTLPNPIDPAQTVEPNVDMALQALENSGMPWLLLRGEDDLARPSGDVDILVAEELLPGLDSVLGNAGFRRVLAPGHGSHRFYFAYSPDEDYWVKLDVVSEVAFGPHQQWRTALARRCLGRRIRSGSVWLPAEADKAWLLLLHLFLDKGEVTPAKEEAARSAAEAASAEDAIARFVDRRMGQGTARSLLDVVLSGRLDDVPATAARMRSLWAARGTPPRLLALRSRVLRRLGARVRGRGPVVGVMAPDGAGKTTLLHGLKDAIPLPTRYVYMGLWGAGPWDSWLRRIPGGRSAKKVFRVIRGGLTARCFSLLGRIVLMDRVVYDALLPGIGGSGPQGTTVDSLAFALVPDPDALLVLDVSGAVMFERKGEHSPEILEGWRQAYRQLSGKLPRSVILDAARPPELVQREATGILWRMLTPASSAETPASADARSQAGYPGPAAGEDEDSEGALALHLWRLLDWRFLLPGLQAGTVGYGGSIGAELDSALHLLDPGAVEIRVPQRSTDGLVNTGGQFDLVLLAAPDWALFRTAGSAMEPGGWICVEARRSLLAKSGPRTLNGWKRAFHRDGYEDVAVYWNAPSLDATARLVPVTSDAGIKDTLSLHKDVRFGSAKAFAAHVALALGMFELAIPGGTIVGRKPRGGSSSDIH